jgi:hypothetical protein
MDFARRAELDPYVTKDGSTIREWAGPGYAAPARNQSVAEATVPPGSATAAHHHVRSELLLPALFARGHGPGRVALPTLSTL